jgi:DNA-binding GntR family transcriptional regulator
LASTAKSWALDSVERASMTERVLRELRKAIIDGRIPQGEQLREVQLAGSLGTGRTAVREAIRQLVQEGLVEYEVHRGAYVRVMSLADRLDVYVAREAIESGAVRRVIESGDPIPLDGVRGALEELKAAASAQENVSDALIAADIRFHQELVRLARSPRLSRAHQTLAAETEILLRHHPAYPQMDYVADHAKLFDALQQRDPETPELVVEHLRFSAQLIGAELARESTATNDEEVEAT